MSGVLVLLVGLASPFCELFLSDVVGGKVSVLPAFAVPRSGGGWLPTPPPPSEEYVLAAARATGRAPGDRVVSRRLESEQLGATRNWRPIGKGRLWVLHYRCDVVGPDGPYTIYVDRNAIVRVP